MLDAPLLLKTVLNELGLQSFPKTSGGKGVGVVVPLARKHSWSEVKAFFLAVAARMTSVLPSGPRCLWPPCMSRSTPATSYRTDA